MSATKEETEKAIQLRKAKSLHSGKAVRIDKYPENWRRIPYENAIHHNAIGDLARLAFNYRRNSDVPLQRNVASIGFYDKRMAPPITIQAAYSGGNKEMSQHAERIALLHALEAAAGKPLSAAHAVNIPHFNDLSAYANQLNNIPIVRAYTERIPCQLPFSATTQNCHQFLQQALPPHTGTERSVHHSIPLDISHEMEDNLMKQLERAGASYMDVLAILAPQSLSKYAPSTAHHKKKDVDS